MRRFIVPAWCGCTVAGLVAVTACAGSSGESPWAGAGETADAMADEAATTEPEGASESGAAVDDESGTTAGPEPAGFDPKFDLGAQPEPPEPREPEPCHEVDLLFVVDNSGSMAGEQENLVTSFPGFVAEMQAALESVETLHVGAISTDENIDNTLPCATMGGLITKTPYATCGPYAEGNYMTEADPLGDTFACAATLGTGGSGNERPMDAMRLALSDPLNAPGACNAGFLRDEALLVVVVITDEEDDHESIYGNSQDDPPEWFDAVVAAKGGVETNAVVLALVGQDPIGSCETVPFDTGSESAEPGVRLMQFTEMFTYGFIGDVCADDYQPFFHEAISVIDSACATFTPPAG